MHLQRKRSKIQDFTCLTSLQVDLNFTVLSKISQRHEQDSPVKYVQKIYWNEKKNALKKNDK